MKPEKEYIIVGKEEFKRTTLDKIITMVWGLVALSSIWIGWGAFHYFVPTLPSVADILTFMWSDTQIDPPPPLTPTPQTIYWPESRGGELVAFFPFSGDAEDESGFGRDAQTVGANLSFDRFAQPEGAYYLNGRAFIDLGRPTSSEAVTLSFWFETKAFKNSQLLVNTYPNCTTSNSGLAISHLAEYNNQYLQFSSHNGLEEQRTTLEISPLSTADWHHLAAVFSPNLTQFYINGEFVGESSIGYTPTTNSWLLGGANCAQQPAGFTGSMDSVRLYNYPLTPLDVQELYTREK